MKYYECPSCERLFETEQEAKHHCLESIRPYIGETYICPECGSRYRYPQLAKDCCPLII